MTANAQVRDIRERSARLRRFLTVLALALTGMFVLERFGLVGLQLASGGDAWRRLALQAVTVLPEVFWLCALWWVRQALAAIARGDIFAPTIARMLERVGATLAAGALAGTFVVPPLQRALGADPGYWIAFDVAGVVLGALGLSLTVIAHVLRRAAAVQAELDEMF
jgi:hypothetical protein